jgi:hypothetical protein
MTKDSPFSTKTGAEHLGDTILIPPTLPLFCLNTREETSGYLEIDSERILLVSGKAGEIILIKNVNITKNTIHTPN